MKIPGLGLEISWEAIQTLILFLLGRAKSMTPPTAAEKAAGISASTFGWSMNDEFLYHEALALAKRLGWMKTKGERNLRTVFGRLEYWEKRRFYKMVGLASQTVDLAGISAAFPPTSTTTQAGVAKKATIEGNIRGALVVAFYANMNPDDAVELLRNSGTLSGIGNDAKELWRQLQRFLVSIGVTTAELARFNTDFDRENDRQWQQTRKWVLGVVAAFTILFIFIIIKAW